MSFALFILGVFWSFDLYFPLSGPGSLYGTVMVTSHFPSLCHHQRTATRWPVHGTDPVFRTLTLQHCRVLTQNKTFPHFFLFCIYWSHVCTCRSMCHRACMEVKEQLEGLGSLFSACMSWRLNSGQGLGSKYLYLLSHLTSPKCLLYDFDLYVQWFYWTVKNNIHNLALNPCLSPELWKHAFSYLCLTCIWMMISQKKHLELNMFKSAFSSQAWSSFSSSQLGKW